MRVRLAFLVPALALAGLAAAAPLSAAPLRYMPGDVLQALLEAQDHRAWTRAEVVKTETTAGAKGAPGVSRGLMTSSGRRGRLDISAPQSGLIVADGKSLWVELPQVGQVYRYKQAELAASGNFFLDLASSIRHYAKGSVKRRFHPGPGYDESEVSAFQLTPDRGGDAAGFRSLRVWVDTTRWVVLRVLLDYGGTRDDIRFQDIRVLSWKGLRGDPGLALPQDTFQYRKPKGYEVFNIDL